MRLKASPALKGLSYILTIHQSLLCIINRQYYKIELSESTIIMFEVHMKNATFSWCMVRPTEDARFWRLKSVPAL